MPLKHQGLIRGMDYNAQFRIAFQLHQFTEWFFKDNSWSRSLYLKLKFLEFPLCWAVCVSYPWRKTRLSTFGKSGTYSPLFLSSNFRLIYDRNLTVKYGDDYYAKIAVLSGQNSPFAYASICPWSQAYDFSSLPHN